MKNIPETHGDLFRDETKAFVFLATLMVDGSPQVTPVWFNTDETYILINTAVGRIKERNMHFRPNVALCITDPMNPYRYIQIRGRVIESTLEGADEHIDKLAFKYLGATKYPNRQPGEKRILYKILPEKIDAHR